MSRRTKRFSVGIFLLFLVGIAGAAGVAYYVVEIKPTADAELHKAAAPQPEPAPVKRMSEKPQAEQVTVYTPASSGMDVTFTPGSQDLPAGADPKVFALNAYLKLVPAVPQGAEVTGVVVVSGTATVNGNKAFGEASYGSMDEKLVLDGICATLGQFSDVEKVVIQVEGKPIDSLGHADLTVPMDVIHVAPAPPKAN